MKRFQMTKALSLYCLMLSPLYAWPWANLWKTPDQQGQALMKAGRYQEAAKTFQRQDWRATAAFEAADYQHAAADFQQLATPDGHYNAGNAWAKSGDYRQAINEYNKAIAQDPKHQDAIFNRDLVQKLLKQQEKNQQNKPSDKASKSSDHQADKPNQSADQKAENAQKPSSEQSNQANKQKDKTPAKQEPKPSKAESKAEDKSETKPMSPAEQEQQKANQQWLQLIPDDPGGLIREKFRRDHLRREGRWP